LVKGKKGRKKKTFLTIENFCRNSYDYVHEGSQTNNANLLNTYCFTKPRISPQIYKGGLQRNRHKPCDWRRTYFNRIKHMLLKERIRLAKSMTLRALPRSPEWISTLKDLIALRMNDSSRSDRSISIDVSKRTLRDGTGRSVLLPLQRVGDKQKKNSRATAKTILTTAISNFDAT
ncbi:hypothetical protein TOPH_02401, partial [Tolypocladium ophioglossoides CBS 100239]